MQGVLTNFSKISHPAEINLLTLTDVSVFLSLQLPPSALMWVEKAQDPVWLPWWSWISGRNESCVIRQS